MTDYDGIGHVDQPSNFCVDSKQVIELLDKSPENSRKHTNTLAK